MREDVERLKGEVKDLQRKVKDAREQTGRMGIRMLEAQEALEKAKTDIKKLEEHMSNLESDILGWTC